MCVCVRVRMCVRVCRERAGKPQITKAFFPSGHLKGKKKKQLRKFCLRAKLRGYLFSGPTQDSETWRPAD